MLDETTQAESQADEANQSQADANTAAPSQAEEASESISLEKAKELRTEAKGLRSRLKDAETKLASYETEKLTESERLKQETEKATQTVAQREGSLKNLLLQGAVAELKDEVGLRSTKSITKLIDTDKVEFDLDKLQVTGVIEELKRLKKEDPDLFVKGSGDGGAGNGDRPGGSLSMNDIMRGKMKR